MRVTLGKGQAIMDGQNPAREALTRVTARLLAEGQTPIVGIPSPRTVADRRALTARDCTLDGRPAAIIGARCDFATVATLPNGPAYQYSWDTVARIVARDGRFTS